MSDVIALPGPVELPAHSRLGGSGAYRWIPCPGSVSLIEAIKRGQADAGLDEEPAYRIEGSVAHEAAAHALKHDLEAWELVDMEFLGHKVTPEMTDDINVYLEAIENIVSEAEDDTLDVTDFKFGMGVVVEVEDNEQLMYYAFGLLNKLKQGIYVEQRFHRPDLHKDYFGTADHVVCGDNVTKVKLRIIQPRAFHPNGPVREWTISVNDLLMWGNEVLLPAMEATEWDDTLSPGEHCRFCEARMHCEALKRLKDEMRLKVELGVEKLPLSMIVDEYMQIAPIKMRFKAIEEATYNLLNRGEQDERVKLVAKKSDRVWKAEAEAEAIVEFGDAAYDPRTLKSPAGIDKAGPKGKKFTAEYAYSPFTGTTVALAGDKRAAVKVKSKAETFSTLIAGESHGDSD